MQEWENSIGNEPRERAGDGETKRGRVGDVIYEEGGHEERKPGLGIACCR
jgi:hypothetical protein